MKFDAPMKWILKSPLHGVMSGNTMLIGWKGRKSGKEYSTPVNYLRDGNTVWVTSQRDRTWWRNFIHGAPVTVWLAGQKVNGRGEAIVDKAAVAKGLQEYFRKGPQYAKYFQVGLDAAGEPKLEDCQNAAQKRVLVRIDLQEKLI